MLVDLQHEYFWQIFCLCSDQGSGLFQAKCVQIDPPNIVF